MMIKKIWFLLVMVLFLGCEDSSVKNDHTPPVFVMPTTVNVNENESFVMKLKAADASNVRYYIVGGDMEYFDIDSKSGVVTFKELPDFEKRREYHFVVLAEDEAGNQTSTSITVYIRNLNDEPLTFTSGNDFSIMEKTNEVIDINATDRDYYDVKYSLSGSDATFLDINTTTGVVHFKSVPDCRIKNLYNFTVSASDGFDTIDQNITVHILDKNEYPPVILNQDTNFFENSLDGIYIDVNDSDCDSHFSYSLLGTSQEYFVIDQNGTLHFKTPPNYEQKKQYEVDVDVSDGVFDTNKTFTINILNQNDAPQFTKDILEVNENSTEPFSLGVVDEDNDTLSYNIFGIDAESFELDNATGEIAFLTAPDYEQKSSYDINVSVSDGNVSVEKELTIKIKDLVSPIIYDGHYPFVPDSQTNWFVDSSNSYEDGESWASDTIGDSNLTCIFDSVSLEENTTLSFMWKVSSESGCDFLHFYIDGEEKDSISGVLDWSKKEYNISSGEHELKWCYTKDGSVSSGDDRGWIDEVNIGTNQLDFSVDENSPLGTVVGKINIANSNDAAKVSAFTLYGDGSDKFDVENNGSIVLIGRVDYETNNLYTLLLDASSLEGNSNRVTIVIHIKDVYEKPLYIVSSVYDDNQTDIVEDDIVYNYFSTAIDEKTLDGDVADFYNVENGGSIGSSSQNEYNATLFYEHKIMLNDTSYPFIPYTTTISLTQGYILGANGEVPLENNVTVVEAYKRIVKTDNLLCYSDENASEIVECNASNALHSDGYYQYGNRGYIDNGDGTILDTVTGLIWQQEDDNTTKTFDDATTYCNDLELGDANDWRLPTRDELVTLIDFNQTAPAINPLFVDTNASLYWSGDSFENSEVIKWLVGFENGSSYASEDDSSEEHFVRCVRYVGNQPQ